MLTRRLLIVAASATLLVAATAGSVVSQPDAGNHYLTGTMTFVEDIDAGTSTHPEGVLEVRGASAAYDLQMSDPRVSGALTTLNTAMDGYGDLRLAFDGEAELASEDGNWAGNWTGVFEPTLGWQMLYKFEGEGELEGLTFYLHGASPEMDDGIWEMDGFIAGEPPAE